MGKNKYGKNKLSEKKVNKINSKIDESKALKKISAEAMKDPMDYTSKHLNKKFRLKKVDKETKKYLVAGCEHTFINKKGRRKAAVKSENGVATCRICGRRVSTDLVTPDEMDRAFDLTRGITDQCGFSIGILNLGVPADRYHHMSMYRMVRYEKFLKKVLKLAAKDGEVRGAKKNGNGNGYNGGNSGPAGGWI